MYSDSKRVAAAGAGPFYSIINFLWLGFMRNNTENMKHSNKLALHKKRELKNDAVAAALPPPPAGVLSPEAACATPPEACLPAGVPPDAATFSLLARLLRMRPGAGHSFICQTSRCVRRNHDLAVRRLQVPTFLAHLIHAYGACRDRRDHLVHLWKEYRRRQIGQRS